MKQSFPSREILKFGGFAGLKKLKIFDKVLHKFLINPYWLKLIHIYF